MLPLGRANAPSRIAAAAIAVASSALQLSFCAMVFPPESKSVSCGSARVPATPKPPSAAPPMARMSTSFGVVPPMTKPEMSTPEPVPTKPRVEIFASRVAGETIVGRTLSVADALRAAPLAV